MELLAAVFLALAVAVALVLVSYAVEALRRSRASTSVVGCPDLSVEYASVDGVRMRYIRTGSGPTLVLLHTLRTQLDIFQRVIPALAERFTVYACDYPGHGWSDIPQADYTPVDFYRWTTGFLETMDIADATLVGVSIGGTIALVLAARGNPRIARVVAINPYDYAPAGGIRRSSLMARLILGPADVPVLGATLMRLRSPFVSNRIMAGGVAAADALSAELKRTLYDVGNRRGHYQGFLSLLSHEAHWSDARSEYPRIDIPVLLIYGAQDWAPAAARDRTRALISGVATTTIEGGGHFLPLDRPQELTQRIVDFARRVDDCAHLQC